MQLRHAVPPARSESRQGRGRDGGETLVEVLVMIVLMGVGFAAIFSGLMTVSRINDANARRTKASNAVQSWAEGLQQPARTLTGSTSNPYTYIDCYVVAGGTYGADYGATGRPNNSMPPSWASQPMNSKPVKVEFLTGFDATTGEPSFSTSCPATGDKGLQRITLKVETPPGEKPRVVDTLVIIKRRQNCPPVTNSNGTTRFDNADLGPC